MVNWTSEVDALFFKSILSVQQVKVNYEEVAKAMNKEGVDVTAKALMHRVGKFKSATTSTKPQQASDNTTNDAGPSTAPASTTAKKAISTGKPRGKKRQAAEMASPSPDYDRGDIQVNGRSATPAGDGLVSPGVEGGDEGAGGPSVKPAKKPRAKKAAGEGKPKSPRAKKAKTASVVRDETTGEIVKVEGEDEVKVEEGEIKEEEDQGI